MNSQLDTLLVTGLMEDRMHDAAKARQVREIRQQQVKSPRKSRRWFPRPGFARSLGA
jgi:hypothetical protein